MDANVLFPSPPLGVEGVSVYEAMSHHSPNFEQSHTSWCLHQNSNRCTCKLHNRSTAVPVWVKLKTRQALEKPFPFERTTWRLRKEKEQPPPKTKNVYFGLPNNVKYLENMLPPIETKNICEDGCLNQGEKKRGRPLFPSPNWEKQKLHIQLPVIVSTPNKKPITTV